MKTLVAIHMPAGLREKFMGSLPMENKRELIEAAMQLHEIGNDELRTFDGTFKNKLNPESQKDVVPLKASMSKLIEVLSPMEQISILSGMRGSAIDQFKRITPVIAFLGQWPDDKLAFLLASSTPDEIHIFLRVCSDLTNRFLTLCPPMTAEVVREELARPDTMKDKEKNRVLGAFSKRLKDMIDRRELDLDEIFSTQQDSLNGTEKAA